MRLDSTVRVAIALRAGCIHNRIAARASSVATHRAPRAREPRTASHGAPTARPGAKGCLRMWPPLSYKGELRARHRGAPFRRWRLRYAKSLAPERWGGGRSLSCPRGFRRLGDPAMLGNSSNMLVPVFGPGLEFSGWVFIDHR